MKHRALIILLMLLFTQTPAGAAETLYVPSVQYKTIQSAVNAALDGDTIIVMPDPGIYYPPSDVNGIDFGGKAIRLMAHRAGEATIDCRGFGRAFTFDDGEDANSIVEGFIIINGLATGRIGTQGLLPGGLTDPTKPKSPPKAKRGENVIRPDPCDPENVNGYGGAILCSYSPSDPNIKGSSPTIRNCVITNCRVTGAWGGRGDDGQNGKWYWPDPDDPDKTLSTNDGQWGGRGGNAVGDGHGGAIACIGDSSPRIENCTMTNNSATGGVGGDGGDGGDAKGGGEESAGGNGGYGSGQGSGGAIYCGIGCLPDIINCTFSNNLSRQGQGGSGGLMGEGKAAKDPVTGEPLADGRDGGGSGNGYGGAIYYATRLPVDINNCTFTGNNSNTAGGAVYCELFSDLTITETGFSGSSAGIYGGAIFCQADSNLTLYDCPFIGNSVSRGGGGAIFCDPCCNITAATSGFSGNSAGRDLGYYVYKGSGGAINCGRDSTLTLTGCSFGGNSATDNGGAISCISPSGHGSTLTITNCAITGNTAKWGGGMLAAVFNATLTDCFVISNSAESGGGLYWEDGLTAEVNGGAILDNTASAANGAGGGLCAWTTDANISNCNISNNSAGYSGGAISLGLSNPSLANCLLTANSAGAEGGAIHADYGSRPVITNCTFSADAVSGASGGGALFCDNDSDPTVTDCIFHNCDGAAIRENYTDSDVTLSYSLFFANPNGDYYDADTLLIYTGAGQINSIPDGFASFNIDGDPLFVSGPLGGFYLGQVAAGQAYNSPAVNAGSAPAVSVGLDTFTTRIDSVGDVGAVDMGYHYIDVAYAVTFELTATVSGDQGGMVEPTAPQPVDYNSVTDTYTYYAGAVVTLTATPQTGWRVRAWSGTDDDSSVATTNTAIMISDRAVAVEFERPRTLVVSGEGPYTDVQRALDDARDGDTVLVMPGEWDTSTAINGFLLDGKAITLTSFNPYDPCMVADTIFRDRIKVENVGPDTIITGFTFLNIHYYGGDGEDGKKSGQDGYNGGETFGAGLRIGYESRMLELYKKWYPEFAYMYPDSNASPTIIHCVIDGCTNRGGDGGKGHDGEDANGWPGNGGWGGRAGGGGAYIGPYCNPTFKKCKFVNCGAYGGDGGDGGNKPPGCGGSWGTRPDAPYWEYAPPGGFEDYWYYSGYGGAIHCDVNSSPAFVDCTVSNSRSEGGHCGKSGNKPGWPVDGPINYYNIENFGGAVYCGPGSTAAFKGCVINNNIADTNCYWYNDDPYVSYGGAVAIEDGAAPAFEKCTFSNSVGCIGGGVYWNDSDPLFSDCNFVGNSSLHGGGAYFSHSKGTIIGGNFSGNYTLGRANRDDPDFCEEIPGEGGAIHCFDANATIVDCNITNNYTTGSGGGIYIGGSDTALVKNCLITNNSAARDGGGISANWYSEPSIINSTISNNIATGSGFEDGYGGGVYCSYDSFANIIDTIIWANLAAKGSQLAVGTGFEYDQRPAEVTVTHTCLGPRYAYLAFNPEAVAGAGQVGGAVLVDGATIYDQFNAGQDWVKIIVSLTELVEMRKQTNWDSPESVAALRVEITRRQSAVLSSLTSGEFSLRYRYENQACFSGEVTAAGLDKLLANPLVAHIEPVRYTKPLLAQAIPLANALEARQLYDASGIAIAIVDTGIDYTHPRLGGGGFPNSKVIGGYDTAEDDSNPRPAGEAHGTCCAGIAAGDLGTVGDYIGGVAPGAKLYALKASRDYLDSFADDALLAAWDWCITHRNDDPANPIMVMNNSWGYPGFPFNDPAVADAFSPAFTVAAETCAEVGITILAAAGNDGFAGDGISWPAAMSKVFSVGAVFDINDRVTPYSNTADILDILAPADPVYTTDIVGFAGYDLGDYFPYFAGTSSACPFAAGAVAGVQAAALAEIGSYLSPGQARVLLTTSGDSVTDTKVAITKPRVNLGNAIDYLTSGPIYVDEGCTLNGWDWNPDTNNWDPNISSHNIDDEPLFVNGYYLSQVAAGQLVDSNCVDTGSNLASVLGLDGYTTRTDSAPDGGIVDMGYHYRPFGVPQYRLTFRAVGDPEPVIVEPTAAEPDFYEGFHNWYTTVALRIDDNYDANYYQVLWTGTDNDDFIGPNNTVTLDSDRAVTVQFAKSKYDLTIQVAGGNGRLTAELTEDGNPVTIEAPCTYPVKFGTVVALTAYPEEGYRVRRWTDTDDDTSTSTTNTVTMFSDKTVTVEFGPPRTIYVPGDYPTIEAAIAAARDGDIIQIATGTYYTSRSGLLIDKEIMLTGAKPDDPSIVAATIIDALGRAFTFTSNAGPGAVLNGLTIANGSRRILPAKDGKDPGDNGHNGGGIQGGAIYCSAESSPTIKNCVIRDFKLWGGDAGDGADANELLPGGHGGWGGWARGCGVYIASYSSPTFINTTITNCTATGGDGGDGGNGDEGEDPYWWRPPGHGGNWSDGILWKYWGYIGDYRYYSGYGGGVYCDANSSPTFIACTITANRTRGGMSGIGGDPPQGTRWAPVQSYEIPTYGGGVYCAKNSTVEFIDCTLTDNEANKPGTTYHLNPNLGHGGGIAFEETASIKFTNCNITDNIASVGGGMYWIAADPEIVGCNVSGNLAYQGGGMFGTKGSAYIENCVIKGNFAGVSPNDVDVVAGQGGGIYSASMAAQILDCNIVGNRTDASGGGIFFTGSESGWLTVTNCLLISNEADRDGGAISADWHARPNIANCTFVNNVATGIGFDTGYGGGLCCSYESNVSIVNSIFWDNIADNGSQIAVTTGFEYDPRPAAADVNNSDVQGSRAHIFVDTGGCTLTWGAANLNADPCFVAGPLGDYYLSQIDTGDPNQTIDSPCVDRGSDYASYLGLNVYTTRTDHEFDKDKVDIGYHYLLLPTVEACKICDLFRNGKIDFSDFAKFALKWLDDDCLPGNDWCAGADFTFDSYVNWLDLAFFGDCWLVKDTDPPIPNPSEWEIEPRSTSPTSISMTAKPAVDAWGWDVRYCFECVYGDCHDSGWQDSPTYEDTGLALATEYGYKVRARDTRPVIPDDGTGEPGNKTEWSVERFAITGEDTTPPTPDPMTWADPCYIATPNSITLFATTATDESGVEYYFKDFNNPAFNSGWIDEPNWQDTNLVPDTTYRYRVRARDKSVNQNETAWSIILDVNTLAEGMVVDTNAPIPNPSEWAPTASLWTGTGYPQQYSKLDPGDGIVYYWHRMEAVTATDSEGSDPVWYYFECYAGQGQSSGWQLSPVYDYRVYTARICSYRVKTRDSATPPNVGQWSEIRATQ